MLECDPYGGRHCRNVTGSAPISPKPPAKHRQHQMASPTSMAEERLNWEGFSVPVCLPAWWTSGERCWGPGPGSGRTGSARRSRWSNVIMGFPAVSRPAPIPLLIEVGRRPCWWEAAKPGRAVATSLQHLYRVVSKGHSPHFRLS